MSKRVVVAGGGVAGLEVALRAEKKGFKVTVIDPRPGTVFYPSWHRVLEGEKAEKYMINFESKFSGRDIQHVQEKVTDINFERKEASTGTDSMEYDYLVLAAGSETNFNGVQGKEYAYTMRSSEDAYNLYSEIESGEASSITVVGGGATGVEATASLLSLRKEKDIDVTLVHASERLLPRKKESIGEKVEACLRDRGANIILESKAEELTEGCTVLKDGTEIESDAVIWAGGVKASEMIRELEVEQCRKGVDVDKHMLTDCECVFATGDVCHYRGKENRALYALFESKTVASNIVRMEKDKGLKERNIPPDPEILSIGERNGLLEYRGRCITGITPHLMRTLGVEKRYLWTRRHLM